MVRKGEKVKNRTKNRVEQFKSQDCPLMQLSKNPPGPEVQLVHSFNTHRRFPCPQVLHCCPAMGGRGEGRERETKEKGRDCCYDNTMGSSRKTISEHSHYIYISMDTPGGCHRQTKCCYSMHVLYKQ